MGERRDMHTRFWWGELSEGELERPRLRWEDKVKMDVKELDF
jgi:hypothetical protein